MTLAALASLIIGYYLGQAWQRQPLSDLSAIVYANGRPVDYPAEFRPAHDDTAWRLFVAGDPDAAACTDLRRDFALLINRLAARPELQRRVRLALISFAETPVLGENRFHSGYPWVDLVELDGTQRETLARQLGILPTGEDWCRGTQASGVLVSPDAVAWALIPYERPDIMAHNITSLIDFVE